MFYAWVDYDLGGVQIFALLDSLLPNRYLKAVIPSLPLDVLFRAVDLHEKREIEKLADSGSAERGKLGRFILERGKIEQEYFIREYKVLLMCMKRGID